MARKNNLKTKELSFMGHLVELRTRIVRSLLAVVAGAVVSLIFCKKLYSLLQEPMLNVLPEGSFFIATAPFESYKVYFKISLLGGIFLASPIIFYQFWAFIAPGLKKKERKYILPFALASALLFTGGALFGYFIVFPTGFYYVNLILEGTAIHLLPKMSDYLSVAVTMLLAFGVTFELPLVILLAGKMGLIDYNFIKKNRRYVIVSLFVLAAVLTPGPDVLSQCLMALPLWILYEFGGLTLLLMKKKEVEEETI